MTFRQWRRWGVFLIVAGIVCTAFNTYWALVGTGWQRIASAVMAGICFASSARVIEHLRKSRPWS